MAGFSFRAPKPKKKLPQKSPITESQIREDNPDLIKIMESNSPSEDSETARLKNEVTKQKLRIEDHKQIHTYSCLVFQSEAQKFEFLAHFPNVLCIDEVFIDGETFAEAIGIKLTLNELPSIEAPINKKFSEISKIPHK
jgi:hypothetical protein